MSSSQMHIGVSQTGVPRIYMDLSGIESDLGSQARDLPSLYQDSFRE